MNTIVLKEMLKMVKTLEGMIGELAGDIVYYNRVMTMLKDICNEECEL